MNDPRGSIWRKWDLHVHSPASDGFIGSWEQFESQLKKAECDVIGINDYFSVEGYKRTKKRIEDGELDLGDKVILPVVEFRMRDVLKNKHTSQSGDNINFHVIFSNNISVSKIETFIKSLEVDDSQIADNYDNPKYLKDTAKVYFEKDVIAKLKGNKDFRDKFIVWLPYNEHGGIDDIDPKSDDWIKRGFIEKSHILGSSNKEQIDFFLWKSPQKSNGKPKFTQTQFEKWFKVKKACIKGSDSHSHKHPLGRLKDRDSNPIEKYCWIKADTTFEGLKQSLIEPESRIWIGEKPEPLIRVEQNKTKYINQLSISKLQSSSLDEKWFEDLPPIPLNNDLVAIIGNKGNGKSALADIIGLVGNSRNHEGFSFLNTNKFRKKRPNRSESFKASIEWANGAIDGPVPLYENLDQSLAEKVKYIPQSYLEKLCTETDEKKFSEELKKVIFSHVDESEKLGKYSLDELISYKSEEINKGLQRLKSKISETNEVIASIEAKNTPEYRSKIEHALDVKNAELEVHKKNKPPQVKEPKKDKTVKEKQEKTSKSLAEIKGKQKDLEEQIQEKRETRKNLALKLARLQKFQQSLNNFREQYNGLKEQYKDELKEYNIDFEKIVKLTINKKVIETDVSDTRKKIQTIDDDLNDKKQGSLAYQYVENDKKIKDLQSKLDEPTRKFQEFQDKIKAWKEKEKELMGAKDKQGSINFYKGIIEYLDSGLNSELENKRKEREQNIKWIFSEKVKIVELYKDLYKPVTEFISEYGELMKDYKINLDVSIQLEDFHEKFFGFISRGTKGSFNGMEEGHNALNQITEGVDFNSEDQLLNFLKEILDHLEHDKRNDDQGERGIVDQLKQGFEVKDFYDFLFGLDYLEPNYKLRLGEKNISELSPGERGALLLIFYLLLDKQDIPLIIDQPEENLDNQSVYRILVKFIKEAKKKRQIIIVTHNPNLAVVCDAEQVICVKIEKENKNKVSLISGAIENPAINTKVVEILEGTFPAFDNRTEKYRVSKYL